MSKFDFLYGVNENEKDKKSKLNALLDDSSSDEEEEEEENQEELHKKLGIEPDDIHSNHK